MPPQQVNEAMSSKDATANAKAGVCCAGFVAAAQQCSSSVLHCSWVETDRGADGVQGRGNAGA